MIRMCDLYYCYHGYVFSSSHVWMWELDNKASWTPNNWCSQTVMLEKTLESSLDCKEFEQVNSKGNQSWIFIGRTDAEAEAAALWPPDGKSWLTGKDWCWERLNTMVGLILTRTNSWNGRCYFYFELSYGLNRRWNVYCSSIFLRFKNWWWLVHCTKRTKQPSAQIHYRGRGERALLT